MECLAIMVTIIFSCLTAFFSFLAYRHSKERFRLELLEKRWEIYEKTLQFCSTVMKHAGIPKRGNDEDRNKEIVDALTAAHESFRGIGYHKTRALFGPEIHKKFDELSEAYSFFVTYSENRYDRIDEESEKLNFVWETINELPHLFKPYMYFGDFKA